MGDVLKLARVSVCYKSVMERVGVWRKNAPLLSLQLPPLPIRNLKSKEEAGELKLTRSPQKLTNSYRDLEPSDIKSSVEMRNVEDRRFYVGCNWTREDNDLWKGDANDSKPMSKALCGKEKAQRQSILYPA